MAATHVNKLFRHDEVARIVGPDEIDVISPVSAAYGLAIILDSDLAVVDYIQKDDAPRKLQQDELALIATDELLRVSYLSGVPNVSGDKEVGVAIDRLTEEDGISGKEHTIRGKVVLEFRIDRYNRKIANRLHALMKDRDSDRLTKKEFLQSFGKDTKDNIANFTQTFIDENGRPKGGPRFRARGRTDLSPTLEEYGVEFRNILCNVDRRSNLARAIWPSFQYDYKLVVGAKMTAYAISITSSVVGLLFAIGILPPELPPVVAVGEQVNGTASVTADGCQTDRICTVDNGGRVTVSAKPASNYALTGWNCPDCSNDLGEENPVVISGIMDDLTISPIFKPLVTVSVRSNDSQLGDVSCAANGMTSDSCNATAGKEIILRANQQSINASDSSVGEFVEWENCPTRWCAGVDRTLRELRLTVPESDGPDTISISAKFRKDQLIRLRINPIEPSSVGVRAPTVTGCSPPDCIMTREGITDVYTFQQNSESRSLLPLTLSAPAPDVTTSNYAFDTWMCNGGPCSLLDNPENPRTRISLNDDVTITPTYAEQIVITIQNRTVGGRVEYAESLPQNCSRMNNSTYCSFPIEGFDGLPLNIVAQPSNSDDFKFDKWLCEGSWCQESEIDNVAFRALVDDSLTLTPVFAEIKRTELILQTVNGRVQAEADCSPDCSREAGWETRVTALPSPEGDIFKRWECLRGESSCPRGADLTNLAITLTLDHDVTLRPIYGNPPTLNLDFNDTQGTTTSCTPSDCSVTEDSTISFSLDENSLPDTLRFTRWACSSSSGNYCSGIENRSRSSTRIRVGSLSSDITVELTPQFDQIRKASLRIGSPEDGGGIATANCRSDCFREVPWRVTVTAMPADGYEFREWVCVDNEGSCPTGSLSQNPITFEINEDTELEPSFRIVQTPLPDTGDGGGNTPDGTDPVSLTLGGATGGSASAGCGSDCSKPPGWTTSVTATPNNGYRFVEWQCSGSCPTGSASTNANINLTINENTHITPVFRENEIETVRLTINVGTGGEIDRAGEFTSDCDDRQCTYEFPVGSSIHVDADPLSGYEEGRWRRISGNSFSSASNFDIDITLTRDTELEVTFTKVEIIEKVHCTGADVSGRPTFLPNPIPDHSNNTGTRMYVSFNKECDTIRVEYQWYEVMLGVSLGAVDGVIVGSGSSASQFISIPQCGRFVVDDREYTVKFTDGPTYTNAFRKICEVF